MQATADIEEALVKEQEKRAARKDVNKFIEYCMVDSETGKLLRQGNIHRRMHKFIDDNQFSLIIFPRFFGKVLYGKVLMKDGAIKHCRQLKVGDEVVSFSENTLQTTISKVEKITSHRVPIKKVLLKSGRRCTVGTLHQFYTVFGWKGINELVIGDFVAVPRCLPYFGNKSIGVEVAKALGLLIAEGGFTTSCITFTNKDKEVAKELQRISSFKLKLYGNSEKDYKVQPRGKIRKFLRRFGLLGKYSKQKLVPKEIFTATREEILAFLAGYTQGDGSFYFTNGHLAFEISSASEQLIRDISHLLLRFGIFGSQSSFILKTDDKKFPRFSFACSSQMARKTANLLIPYLVGEKLSQARIAGKVASSTHNTYDLLPKSICRRLGLSKLCSRRGISYSYCNISRGKVKEIARVSGVEEVKKHAESNVFWDKIKKIEGAGIKEVPFIQFGPTPTFVGEDIYHHNTTQVLGRILDDLGKNANEKIKVISSSDDIARKRVKAERDQISTNTELHAVYPNLYPDEKSDTWSKSQLTVKREIKDPEPSLEGCGILSTGQGGRATKLYFDDVVSHRNAVKVPKLRGAVKEAFNDVWMNLLGPDGRAVYIATLLHKDDLTHELMKNEKWKKLMFAVGDNYESPWPEKWPPDKLKEREKLIKKKAFDRNFRNKALSDEDILFTADILEASKVYGVSNKNEIFKKMQKFVGVDLAISDTGHYTVLFEIGVENNIRYPLRIVRGHFSSPETAKLIKTLNEIDKPLAFCVENNGYQKSLIQWLKAVGVNAPVISYTTGLNKVDLDLGLPSVALEFESDLWKIPMGEKPHDELCDCIICTWLGEMSDYPIGKYDDTVMATLFAREAFRQSTGDTADSGWDHW